MWSDIIKKGSPIVLTTTRKIPVRCMQGTSLRRLTKSSTSAPSLPPGRTGDKFEELL
jgi:hypothetical protein